MQSVTERVTRGQARSQSPVYYGIPHKVVRPPPIRHRHTQAHRRFVSPFEYAVMSGVMIIARRSWSDDKSRRAWAAGHNKIGQENEDAKNFKQIWHQIKHQRMHGVPYEQAPTPKRRHTFTDKRTYKPKLSRPEAITHAGSEAYRKHMKKLKDEPAPIIITVEQSRSGLLKISGLASNGDNHNILDTAFDRLCEPIGPLPPILTEWQPLKSNRVRLLVSGLWLNLPFQRIPWPLPVKSPTALSLYLFLQSVDVSPVNTTTISIKSLCYKLGMSTTGGSWKRQHILHKALEAVNAYLDTINHKLLREYNISLPGAYEIIEDENDSQRIRFEGIDRKGRDNVEDEDEEEALVPARDRLPRARIRRKVRQRVRPELRTPRFTHEQLTHQVEQDRLKAKAKAKLRQTRTIKGYVEDKYESVAVERVVPITDDELYGRIGGE